MRRPIYCALLVLVVLLALAACSEQDPVSPAEQDRVVSPTSDDTYEEGAEGMTLILTSSAFAPDAAIPRQYTCQGDDFSPALEWTGAPSGTQSFVLIMDDPDAPGKTWVHWVIYNLPAAQTGLAAGIAPDADLPGGVQGSNSWGRVGYGGPCPPSGTHRYYFKLYALDTVLQLVAPATNADVIAAMQGHILAEAQVMGTYKKS